MQLWIVSEWTIFAAHSNKPITQPNTPMSAIANLLTSYNANSTDLVGEWMPGILVRQGKSANFGALLLGMFSRLKVEVALNGQYNYWEREPVRSNFYSNAANATTTSTSLTFDDGAGNAVAALLCAGTVLKNGTTGEYVKVASDPTTNLTSTVVTVVRDFDNTGVTGAAVLDNDVWSKITVGAMEGSGPRRASYETPTNLYNLIETFKSTAYLANYYSAGQIRTDQEGPKKQNIAYALEEIANNIEKAILFGRRVAGNASTEQFTGGITWATDAAITADSSLAGTKLNGGGTAGVSMASVRAWFNTFMTKGSGTKLLVCGPLAYAAFSDYANSAQSGFRIQNDDASKSLGLVIDEMKTPFGTVGLAMHPLMLNDVNFQDYALAIDLGLVRLKQMEKLHFEEFPPGFGVDAYQGQFRAKLGLMQQFAGAGGYAYGLRTINP